jgi:hypothetical protein
MSGVSRTAFLFIKHVYTGARRLGILCFRNFFAAERPHSLFRVLLTVEMVIFSTVFATAVTLAWPLPRGAREKLTFSWQSNYYYRGLELLDRHPFFLALWGASKVAPPPPALWTLYFTGSNIANASSRSILQSLSCYLHTS